MTDVAKLRALLAEAREFVRTFGEAGCPNDQCEHCAIAADTIRRIDEALAEPVEESDGSACPQCGCDNCEAGRAAQEVLP
jgi:hypothetical protein